MKKIFLAVFIASLFLLSIVFAAPTILVEKVDPQPVEPGKDLTIDVTFFNKETTQTEFSVILDYSYPIILKSSTEDLSKVTLCGGCSKKNKYFITIDSKAVSATYPVYIKVLVGGSEITQRVDVKVKGIPNLVFSTDSELSNITPNSKFSVLLDVRNIGSGSARQIKIQSDSTNFVVLGSSVKTIDVINPNQSNKIVFDFLSSSNLEATSYTIPFKFSYLDDDGNALNSTQSLGVRVVNKGELSIQTIKIVSSTGSSLIAPNQPFTIVVRLENIGKGTADSISSQVSCPFADEKKAFLGQLKRDEDAPAVFDLVSKSSGTFRCNLTMSYHDDIGVHTLNETFDVTISFPEYGGMLIILIIIIVVALIIFRKKIPGLKSL